MTDKILRKLKQRLKSLSLSPFADGRYEIFVDGRRIWSKLETGKFPEDDEILAELTKAGSGATAAS